MAISMKTSRTWLQKYFENPLPSADEIADALTFHAFEIEEVVGDDLIDVNILPDRAADCLCHRGIAKEIGAVLNTPIQNDPLRAETPSFTPTSTLAVSVEDESKCLRYIGAVVRGVEVGPSPAWLKEALESVGQRSINNVVDATNYVMLDIGQPLHAFDADRLVEKDGAYAIRVRDSKTDEKITTLSGDEFILPTGTLLITDANSDAPVGIAGVKGGIAAQITTATTDIVIESATFNASLVRKTSQKLKLWTDASQRYQNNLTPELAAYGMKAVLDLIQKVAGGEVEGVVDVYPAIDKTNDEVNSARTVSVSLEKINSVLGSKYGVSDVEDVFSRLEFEYTTTNDMFEVIPPFERRDISIPENLIEEVGRILGYQHIAPELLPKLDNVPDQNRYHGIERIKDFLIDRGFTELSTQTFATAGEIGLANPLDQTKPALRAGLSENMQSALTRAASVAPRVLGPAPEIKLFEIGTVFKKDGEYLSLVLGCLNFSNALSAESILRETTDQLVSEMPGVFASNPEMKYTSVLEVLLADSNLEMLGADYTPRKIRAGAYKPFSIYPFALRDIAVWTPERTEQDEVSNIIMSIAAQEDFNLARIDLFDRFSKVVDGVERISYAFRLVFESFDRTLSDEDLNPLMDKITAALNASETNGQKWEVR